MDTMRYVMYGMVFFYVEAEDMNSSTEVGHQENTPVMCTNDYKKKAKKSVRMTETVVVQECDGEVSDSELV